MKPPSKAQQKRESAFNTSVLNACRELGAVIDMNDPFRPTATFTTVCGKLSVTPIDTWIACRFDDPWWAKHVLRGVHYERLNPYSGKWNFQEHGNATLEWFVSSMREVLALEPTPRPLELHQLPTPPKGYVRVLLRNGQTAVVKAQKRFGSVWAVHQTIRAVDPDGGVTHCPGRVVVHVPSGVAVSTNLNVSAILRLAEHLAAKLPDVAAGMTLGQRFDGDDHDAITDLIDAFHAQESP